MSGPLLKSLAKEVLQELPPTKPEGLENALLRKGVKPEELKFMKLGTSPEDMKAITTDIPAMLDPKGRITQEELSALPIGRKDVFGEQVRTDADGDVKYRGIIPMDANLRWQSNSYKERVISFKGVNETAETSSHYPGEDYLMHTRLYDELIDGTDTRVVTEIQSDLHQKGLAEPKQLEGNNRQIADATVADMAASMTTDKAQDLLDTLLYGGLTPRQARTVAVEVSQAVKRGEDPTAVYNKHLNTYLGAEIEAPWKSSWMRKGLENEILHAIKEGKQQIAIPIRGTTSKSAAEAILSDIPEYSRNNLQAALANVNNPANDFDDELGPVLEEFSELLGSGYEEYIDYALRAANITSPGRLTIDNVVAELLSQPEVVNRRAINAVQPLMRSEGIQKWYETSVAPTAQKLARQMGSEYRTVNQDGIEYAVIDLSKGANTNSFALYAGGAPLAAYTAFKEGYTEEEIRQGMLDRGFTEEEVADAIAKVPQVEEAKAQDYTDEELIEYFNGQQPTADSEEVSVKDINTGEPYVPKSDTGDAMSDTAYSVLTGSKQLTAEELAVALQTVYPDMSSITTRLSAFFGDEDAVVKAQRTEAAAVERIKQGFAARGAQAEFIEGEWYVIGSKDNPDDVIRITPGMWDTFWAARGETGGAILGGIAGGKAGVELTAASPNLYVRALAIAGGSIAGAVTGSVIGTELDYLRDAVRLSEEISAEVSAHKALTAAEASVIGDLVSLGVLKAGSGMLKGVVRAKDFIVGGNTEGAKQALRDTMFLRESEIDEVVTKLSKVIDTSTMSRAQQEITATALLLPGTQDLVRAAGVIDPKASRAVVRAINDRAADVLKTTGELAGEGAPVKLYEDLNAYTQQTKEYYTAVKAAAATAPRAKYYKFKLEPEALEPVYEQLRANIQDPATLEKFILQVNKAKQHTNGRTFEDLIELRQLVNDFAFNRKITNGKAIGTLRTVIDNLDTRIERGAKFVFGSDEADNWLKEFGMAKAEYAKMKSLERNTLAKLVRRPGVQPELVSQALLRYANSVDGTYEHVMGILPPSSRRVVEGDMVNTLAQKFSIGEAGGPRAVHFPALAQELDKLQLVTPEARKIKAALKELGDVFQNDLPLAESTGMMTVPKFQSYLTADPVIRAKFAAASTVFNYVKTLTPGEAGRQAALLRNTAKFLETPLNAKSLKEFTAELGDSVNLSREILEVQQAQGEAIAKNLDKSAARVKFYGDRDILSTSGTGKEVAIPKHRVASKATAEAIANSEAVSTKDKQALDLVLSKYGFKAVEYGSDKVRLLKP